jgi:hypothetical protein
LLSVNVPLPLSQGKRLVVGWASSTRCDTLERDIEIQNAPLIGMLRSRNDPRGDAVHREAIGLPELIKLFHIACQALIAVGIFIKNTPGVPTCNCYFQFATVFQIVESSPSVMAQNTNIIQVW